MSGLRIVKGDSVYDPTASFITIPTSPFSTSTTNQQLLTCYGNRFVDFNTVTTAKSITVSGTPKVTPFSPFPITTAYDPAINGGSAYFDGSGDNLTITSGINKQFNPSNGFTLECWVYITNTTATQYVFEVRGTTGDWNASTGIAFQLIPYHTATNPRTCKWQFKNGTPTSISGSPAIENAWNHVCVGYDGTTTRVWMNGSSIGTSTAAYSPPTVSNASIGNNVSGSVPLGGYVGGLRFVQGTDIYGVSNTTIDVPTEPFTDIPGTSLLFLGTNAGIYDNSGFSNLESQFDTQIDTETLKYGTGSIKFDGTGDRIRIPYSPEAYYGSQDFTVEVWVNVPNVSGVKPLITYRSDTNSHYGFSISINNNKVDVAMSNSGSAWTIVSSSTETITANTWTHVAVVRNGSNIYTFINGVRDTLTTTYSGINYTYTVPVLIGISGESGNYVYYYTGYMDDFRITKGIARYTANFDPPTKAFPKIGV